MGQGWNIQDGDKYFATQRRNADHANEQTIKFFYELMKGIARDMYLHTAQALRITRRPSEKSGPLRILDMCAAPGGFLETALDINPTALGTAFSLPESKGGHRFLLRPRDPPVTTKFLDLTMLAEDMGVDPETIPADHPDAGNFLPRQFSPDEQLFDLVFADGQVLRTHERAEYRENRESRRLTLTQLVLGLEHMQPRGTIVVLLHKMDTWDSLKLLYTFDQFSRVRLFKPKRAHAKRSSFYMVATEVRSRAPEALAAIEQWRAIWRTATFGTDDEYAAALHVSSPEVEAVLEKFGTRYARLGKPIWDIQAKALEKAPFMRAQPREWKGSKEVKGMNSITRVK